MSIVAGRAYRGLNGDVLTAVTDHVDDCGETVLIDSHGRFTFATVADLVECSPWPPPSDEIRPCDVCGHTLIRDTAHPSMWRHNATRHLYWTVHPA